MFLQVMLCKGRLAQLEQVLKNITVCKTLKNTLNELSFGVLFDLLYNTIKRTYCIILWCNAFTSLEILVSTSCAKLSDAVNAKHFV